MAILLALISLQISAQNRTITGKVTSSQDNETIPGVSVVVPGTTIGTSTDIDGNFKLDVPANATVLRFSAIGMKNKDVAIGASNVVDVVMDPDVMKLDEVVVTALGISKETKSLGYATQQVGGDVLKTSGEVNVIESMSGKFSGVQVVGSGGTPGASSKVLIRGNSTFTGDNQPLLVVDGVPVDNSTDNTVAGDYPFNARLSGVNNSNRGIDINPADIESVNILKGPSAAALYGVRAGAGAIIITTKRGNKLTAGKPITVTLSSNMEFSKVSQLPKLQSIYAQGTGGGSLIVNGVPSSTPNYVTADPGPDQIHGTDDDVSFGTSSVWGPTISSLSSQGVKAYDHYDQYFQTGHAYNNDIAVSGGSEKASMRLSYGNTIQTGVIPNTEFKRNSLRLTTDAKLHEQVSMAASASYIRSTGIKAQNGSNLSGVMLSLTRAPASFDLKGSGPDGYKYSNGAQRQYFFVYDNPYWSAYENPFTDDVNRFMGNIAVTYTPLKFLTATYRIGTDYYTDHRKQVFAIGSWDPPQPTGEIWENDKKFRELNGDFLITLKHKFGSEFNGSITLGNNFNERVSQDLFARGRDLGVPNFYSLSNAANLYASQTNATWRSAALFFDANIDYKSMVFLGITGRNEWSSTFGPNKTNFFYPSVSASFVFSDLIGDNKILSFGKLRVSSSKVGINPLIYSSRTYYVSAFFTDGFTDGISFPFLGQNGFGYSSTNILGNPDLQTEVLTGNEVGLDLRFLNGRVNLDATYYIQKSSEILVDRPIAASSGFHFYRANAGEMENKGIELVLSGDPVKLKDFNWNIMINFTKNTNEVTKLAEGVDEIDLEVAFSSISAFAIVGEPYGVLYGSKWLRAPDGQLIIGSNGLPQLDPLRGKIGDPYPDWQAGIRNTFSYKGINLTALIDIREGGDIWNGTLARLHRLGKTEESANREQNYVIPGVVQNTDGTFSPNTTEVSAFNYFNRYVGDNGAATEQAVYDGSWVRLREVTLSYNIKLKNKLSFIRNLEISATGRNLWLDTDYPGVDPETSLTGAGSNINGFDYFNNPGTKSYHFGIKAAF